jgi:hypothetical protein
MKATSKAPHPVMRDINPRFRDQLPVLMRRVCTVLVKIEPGIKELAVHLKEFQEYPDFEIEKIRLEISKEEWKDRADRAKLDDDREWLAKLKALRADLNIDAMTAPASLIRSLFKRTKEIFGGVGQD